MGFQFSDKTQVIEICGANYYLVKGDASSLIALRKVFDDIASIEDVDKTSVEFIEAHEPIVREFLDGLFGEGTYAEIFAGRRVNLVDMIELITYISEQISLLNATDDLEKRVSDFLEVADEPASS